MKDEKVSISGKINIKLIDKDGNVKDERNIKNLVVTAGKNYLATWLAAASQAGEFMTYLGIGTGTTAPAAGDTTLETEIGTRVDGTLSSTTNVWKNVGTFAAGNGTGAITEAGLLSAATAGTLFARQTFSVINKAAGDSLQVTWEVTLG